MSTSDDLILDECLKKMRRGERLEASLTTGREEEQTLRPLLETAAVLHAIPLPRSSPAGYRQGRERMLAAVEQEFSAPPVSGNVLVRYTVRILTWITGKDNIDMKTVTRFAIALMLALAVMTGLGATAVSANSALPGDLLYPLKTSSQNARLMLTLDIQARQALERHFQEQYRHDVRVLAQQGRQAQVRFVGVVEEVGAAQWVVGGLPITLDPATMVLGGPQIGEMVQVEAAVQSSGEILASRLTLTGAEHHPSASPTLPAQTALPAPSAGEHPEDLDHSSEHTLEHATTPDLHHDLGGTPLPTAAPAHPDDGSSCQDCGSAPSHPQDEHSNGDHHDGGHD